LRSVIYFRTRSVQLNHTASCTNGYWVCFRGGLSGRGVALTTHQLVVTRREWVEPLSRFCACSACNWKALPFTTQLATLLVLGLYIQCFMDPLVDSVCKITEYRGRESKSLRIYILALEGSELNAAAFSTTEEP